nr:circularly permuted type 2 ATP-grasp protein [Actinomycetota bacterium]
LPMSTAPTLDGDGLQPRPVTLRSFAVAVGPSYELMTGGLTRVGADRDSVVLSTASGAASKDVWVLSPADPPAALSRAERPHPPGATDPGGLGPETLPAAVSPRVAHDLYWLGRYAERAESLTRLLRIVDNRWRDLHPAPDPALAECLVVLLQTLTTLTSTWPGFVGEGSGRRLAAPEPELVAVIRAEDRVGSLAHDLRHVRQLATSVRDQLSRETWSVLAALDRGLAHVGDGSGRALGGGVTAGLDTIMQALLALSGLMSENLVHDAGWYLLDTGRRLERALQTVGLLRAGLASAASPAVEELVIESLLIAADSIITHRRRTPPAPAPTPCSTCSSTIRATRARSVSNTNTSAPISTPWRPTRPRTGPDPASTGSGAGCSTSTRRSRLGPTCAARPTRRTGALSSHPWVRWSSSCVTCTTSSTPSTSHPACRCSR